MTTSKKSYYSDSTWSVLKDLGLDQYVPEDMGSGPTLTKDGGGGFFTTDGYDDVYGNKQSNGLPTDRLTVKSRGLLTVGSDTTTIDMADYTVYSNYRPKTNVHTTDWWLYSGTDASAATGKVTYYGLDNDTWYHQWGSNGDSGTLSNPYHHYDSVSVTHQSRNKFKGGDFGNLAYGGHGNDTLIGGAGDDELHGVGGNNKIYGVGGDNQLFGGDGNDIIFGGTGNDFINTGAGNNKVVLGHGDNWVVVPQNAIKNGSTTTYENKLVSGTGTDTFVVGNIPAPETTTTSGLSQFTGGLFANAGVSMGESVIGVGMDALKLNPLVGVMADGFFSVLENLLGGTPSKHVETTEWPTFQTSYIYEFNPLNDRILLPTTNKNDLNYKITGSTSSADDWALEFYDHTANEGKPFLRVDFADAQAIFGDWASDGLSSAEIKGFTQAFLQNCFIMDADRVKFGSQEVSLKNLDLTHNIKDDLGAGGYLFGGAWSGYFLNGNIDGSYYMGTNHDDVLFGYDITGSTINTNTGGGLNFYGFGGDNLFGTGDGRNTVYGGDGNNTVTYQYGKMAIYADMSDKATDPTNSKGYGDYYLIHQGSSDSIVDYDTLYQVQNIVGSRFDDVLIGDELDNTFYSTGGANTWSGGAGENTFVLNGGSATITDYTDGDTIVVYKSVYDTKKSRLEWFEEDDGWTLRDRKHLDVDILTISKNDDYDAPGHVTLYRGETKPVEFMPEVHYAELLAA